MSMPKEEEFLSTSILRNLSNVSESKGQITSSKSTCDKPLSGGLGAFESKPNHAKSVAPLFSFNYAI